MERKLTKSTDLVSYGIIRAYRKKNLPGKCVTQFINRMKRWQKIMSLYILLLLELMELNGCSKFKKGHVGPEY